MSVLIDLMESKGYNLKVTKMETNINWTAQVVNQVILVTPIDSEGNRMEKINAAVTPLIVNMYQYINAEGNLINEDDLIKDGEGNVINGVAEYEYVRSLLEPGMDQVIFGTLELRKDIIAQRFEEKTYNRTVL